MNKETLSNFIEKNRESDDFTGGIEEVQLQDIQNKLGVILPKSYQWFVMNYGSGGMFGVDIVGIGKSNIASVVIETEKYRNIGLDKQLVVIENMGEYAYCLDTEKMENQECPVFVWDKQMGKDKEVAANHFFEFLMQRLLDAKEIWEEDL